MTTHQPTISTANPRLPVIRLALSTVAAGALGALVVVAYSPFSAATAAFSPPLYALVAGAYSIVPFLARRLLGYPWAATAVGCIAALLSAPISPIGLLIIVPFAAAGAAYDSVIWALTRARRERDTPTWIFVVAALVSALVLFLVSLPVLSPNHRIPMILAATLGGRVAGQLAASALAGLITGLVLRVGIGRRNPRSDRGLIAYRPER
jgi:hypothetical protein